MESPPIVIQGAREHNLKNVSLSIPRGKLVCFTGVSGSGKSSLAFDTLFAEGQRRYLESLSSYARQFLGLLAKPDVDQITGLSPAVSIQQKTSGWNPRSTVGTVTQIHDYLRVLFSRVGRQHCTTCGQPIQAQTREQMIARILELPAGTPIHVLAPVVRGQKGEYRDLFEGMIKQGFARVRVDGVVVALADVPPLARHQRHDIEIVVDRLTVNSGGRSRLSEAVESALKLGKGTVIIQPVSKAVRGSTPDSSGTNEPRAGDLLLSSEYACPRCDLSFEAPSPQLFSFNSPQGMCLACEGMGTSFDFDPDLLVPNSKKSFLQLAVEPMRTRIGRWRRHIFRGVAKHVGFDLDTPWCQLSDKAHRALLFGTGDAHITYEWKWSGGVYRHGGTFAGVIAHLRENHKKAKSPHVRAYYEKYMRKSVCGSCGGARLNAQALAVRIDGKNLHDVCHFSIRDARDWADRLELTGTEKTIARDVLKEISGRLTFLCEVGLDYLALDRTAPTLSGGESQRIRLASQIGAGLVGVLYVLDEPSIGLHPRDNERLLDSLTRLRDMGNTVVVVEHDEQTMRRADEIVDFGPGPGVRGGEVVAQGDMNAILKSKRSVTGRFLSGEETIEIPKQRRPVSHRSEKRKRAKSQKGAVCR